MVTIKVEIKEGTDNKIEVKTVLPKTLKGASENEKIASEVIFKNIDNSLKNLK